MLIQLLATRQRLLNNDANNPGTASTSSSNTVTITVAEIAGLYINTAGVVDNTPATTGIQANDTILFDFDVTNVGNDPTALLNRGMND